ncbi:MAG: hypothetical protein JW902_07935 [Syntrophaceae bacterium]|nr:hypothetical protein [Syntrophaceae bacterium]
MSARLLILFILAISGYSQEKAQAQASEGAHYPRVISGELPLYPSVAHTAHISGTIDIEVTVERGAVTDATVRSVDVEIIDPSSRAVYHEQARIKAGQSLSNPSVENVRTWRFASEDRAVFVVRYIYRIQGEATPRPENPKIELDLPHVVTVIARPFKPGCSGCGAEGN